ncbi:hypothetical protein ABIB17_003958 [Arthrobacter sp. UYEF6]
MTRELAHKPLVACPKVLNDTMRRHRCIDFGYVWRHTRRGGKYVTAVIDLTPIREGVQQVIHGYRGRTCL